jgi:proteasome accessory factor B
MAQATTDAVRKLSAAGVGVDLSALDIGQPKTSPEEPSFAACWQAVCERQAIQFDYQRPEQEPARRRVQPWGVVRSSGRWYLVGFDVDRGAERVFRLDRFRSPVRTVGPTQAYEVPPDTDLRAVIARLAPRPQYAEAVLLARTGTGHGFRRRAARVETGVPGPDQRSGWDRIVLDRPGRNLVDEVLYHGADVVLLEPRDLRDEVVARLEGLVA